MANEGDLHRHEELYTALMISKRWRGAYLLRLAWAARWQKGQLCARNLYHPQLLYYRHSRPSGRSSS